MRRQAWQVALGTVLVALSASLYLLHFAIFHDSHHILIYLLGDIAFVPVEVFFVTLIIHRLLEMRERRSLLHKMNMVIGAFFSEVGTELLRHFHTFDISQNRLAERLSFPPQISERDLKRIRGEVKVSSPGLDATRGDLRALKEFLGSKRAFLLALLENPNLLEHESFTELLWATFHLTEELTHRPEVGRLQEKDAAHLAGDMKRAYIPLVCEWLSYMIHLKKEYAYLFSLAIRTNPFDAKASVEIMS